MTDREAIKALKDVKNWCKSKTNCAECPLEGINPCLPAIRLRGVKTPIDTSRCEKCADKNTVKCIDCTTYGGRYNSYRVKI